MSLAPGTTIGRYEVRALLGSGGMGEVYKAHDSTLGRSVALKLLREDVSADADRIGRFLQEARAASALNHPNILTIHEVGTHDQARFIVAELVDGETVRQRVERGPMTLREILDVAIQAASALATAHAAGIVHRDIKPENLMIRPDGYVKVLDFGVAKLTQRANDLDQAGTQMTMARTTEVGMVVGTMAYMSPEQARGLNVDGRADAFSLGVVLYELVTGRAPFTGATATDTLVAIVDKDPPPIRSLARGVPLQLEWIIAKALDKDPNLRYQNIADFKVDLMRLKSAIESGRTLDSGGDLSPDLASVDQAVAIELTDDSPQVRELSSISRPSIAVALMAVAALAAAVTLYDRAHPGADLPLQLPEGAAATKARDVVTGFGYDAQGAQTAVAFDGTVSSRDVSMLSTREEVREAVRAGVMGEWRVGFSPTRSPGATMDDDQVREHEFAVRLDPAGKTVSFLTGVSPQPATALDRDAAIALGVGTVKKTFGVDPSGFEFEFVPRAFPAGVVEMTWRNPQRRFGHLEEFRVHLQGERLTRVTRSLQKPPGFTEPDKPIVLTVVQTIAPIVLGAVFIGGWAFGIWMMIASRSMEPLRQRLPMAICALFVVSVGLESMSSNSGAQSLIGMILIVILMAGTVLPSLSGIVLWIRRRSPARLWAADHLTHGRLMVPAVATSLIDGVLGGAAIAGLFVLGDLLGSQIPGYVPSLSDELNAVDRGITKILSEALAASGFLSIALAIMVETLQWLGLRPLMVALATAAIAMFLPMPDHLSTMALLPQMVTPMVIALVAVTIYYMRGLLAVWLAFTVSELISDALASRSLGDPELTRLAGWIFTIVGVLLVGGIAAYFVRRPRLQRA